MGIDRTMRMLSDSPNTMWFVHGDIFSSAAALISKANQTGEFESVCAVHLSTVA